MKLRYLHIRDHPPLQDVAITFGQERALGRECAIHFVAGVNGSGKSRLLQVVSDVLLGLSRRQVPMFPLTLVYELSDRKSARTVLLHQPGGPAELAQFKVFDQIFGDADLPHLPEKPDAGAVFQGNQLPGQGTIETYLPDMVVIYTSGALGSWRSLFALPFGPGEPTSMPEPAVFDLDRERPPNWDATRELARRGDQPGESAIFRPPDPQAGSTIGIFVPPDGLTAALTAVALNQLTREDLPKLRKPGGEPAFLKEISSALESRVRMPGMRGILNSVDWLWPVTLTLDVDAAPGRIYGRREEQLERLRTLAQRQCREPGGGSRQRLVFDLHRDSSPNAGAAGEPVAKTFQTIIAGEEATPLRVFRELRLWQDDGILTDIGLTVRKRNVPDLLLHRWLSDGERVFLGRMALFHLLRDTPDSLLVLDEPETHFNDVWKREIVDIIDEALGGQPSNVVITTHSSIALTDAFTEEVTLFVKDATTGEVGPARREFRSFGAASAEIMQEVFGASDAVGKRAGDFLEMVLLLAGRRELVERIWNEWNLTLPESEIEQHPAFQELIQAAEDSPLHALPRAVYVRQLKGAIHALREYGSASGQEPSLPNALKILAGRLGAGFYQFELRRRLRDLAPLKPSHPPFSVRAQNLLNRPNKLIIPPENLGGLSAGA
jgi:energy-coupling factor transporter ATP-binding protein EcfA2